MYGPAVRSKKIPTTWRWAVLHQCIRPLLGARCAPDHHGYQRACDVISRQASTGPSGSPVFACAGKTDPPSSSHPLADLWAGAGVDYIVDSSSSLRGCSFVRAWRPFLRPGLRVQTGRAQGAVKVGRRAGVAPRFRAARPRLDGPEHGARITLDGTPSHRS